MAIRGLYIARVRHNDKTNIGVINKCLQQVDAFQKQGFEIELIWLGEMGIYLNKQIARKVNSIYFNSSLHLSFFYLFRWLSIVGELVDFKKIDFLYMRYELSHPQLINFLKKAKKINPRLRIFIEIPTYPYKKESVSIVRRLQLLLDKVFRKYLYKYVYRIVHFGLLDKIFSIPTIKIRNGISVNAERLSLPNRNLKKLNMIAVGNWNHWHGLDRLITGIHEYYRKGKGLQSIKLTIVGGGPSLLVLMNQVKALNLEKNVNFTGPLSGRQLDAAFDNVDIGIGNLAFFRTGLTLAFPLKHREYCFRGLPFILSTHDEDFNKELKWVCYFPNDDTQIDIQKLLTFRDSLSNDLRFREEIHQYAVKNLSWDKKIEPVIEALFHLR